MKLFNSLDLVSVADLLDEEYKFFVPAYQRGYRWTADQAEQLIDDLLEFYAFHYSAFRNKETFYCLQPLVVKLRKDEKTGNEEYLEVIDGQQRLTTILLILQALHLLAYESFVSNTKLHLDVSQASVAPGLYTIKYETRAESNVWLDEVSAVVHSDESYRLFDQRNCDYSHFAEVFFTAYNKLKNLSLTDRNHFVEVLRIGTRFIWYNPAVSSGSNADIFDRLNAGKIGLNNAELVKALLLQRNNWKESEPSKPESLAFEWSEMETALQQKEFWGFIYSSQHPYKYDSHIEYILDLLKEKNVEHRDKRFYTFNCYLDDYRKMMEREGKTAPKARALWAEQVWQEVKEMYDLLKEWYRNKKMYHRIGFILEYVDGETVLALKNKLKNKKHSERIAILDGIIKQDFSTIDAAKLFHGNPELSKILFIYNILLEDRRAAENARFSFADYKVVRKNKGWDQEHIASHTDYTPDANKQKELAEDVIELLTGQKTIGIAGGCFSFANEDVLDEKEKRLCEKAIGILKNIDRTEANVSMSQENEPRQFFASVSGFFETSKDGFGIRKVKGRDKEEKDFIWNFALLNSSTNRSYGNSIYPVNRRRILQDEFNIYTPVGTRNVFEKAYSKKIDQIFYWSKTDAMAYWDDIRATLKPYVELVLPFD